ENIESQNFPLAEYNLNPIGSGPYKIEKLKKDRQNQIQSITFTRNDKYFGKKPYIPEVSFYFLESEKDLIEKSKKGIIKGFSLNSFEIPSSLNLYSFSMPRYFATFFNSEQNEILKNDDIRKALNYGTNKEELVEKVLNNEGSIVNSPILPQIYGFNNPSIDYNFNPEKAKELLEKAGFSDFENGIRVKSIKQTSSLVFKSTLKAGNSGNEVTKLQQCLSEYPTIYPEGTVSGYFGPKTKEAVIVFQEKYKDEILTPSGLTSGTGTIGKSTR
ncbi:unnamed protein product, partial [marine sediment metagenome]